MGIDLKKKQERIGKEKLNNDGELMRIIDYINSHNIIVYFPDSNTSTYSTWAYFEKGCIRNPLDKERLGSINKNKDGCAMKVIKYINQGDIVVEFQDEYKAKVHTQWYNFINGRTKNPYFPSVYGIGIVGDKLPAETKEYHIWRQILGRCVKQETKDKSPSYQDVSICKEWLFYENFYTWLHEQENFKNWIIGEEWGIDKDILIKGNKIYSPSTCCLVPRRVNNLFTKREQKRGQYPIGVTRDNRCISSFKASCANIDLPNARIYIGTYHTPEEAFYAYKKYKENLIQQVAIEEYNKGNIIYPCYEAMMNYKVEITD